MEHSGEASAQQNALFNSAALHALKRHQLVSISKRYGLKASGKNVEMIARLEAYAGTLTPSKPLALPLPAATPASGRLLSDQISEPPTPMPLFKLDNTRALRPRTSDWEVLSDGGASMISPSRPQGGADMTKSGSVRSWKSANNGEAMSEFGVGGAQAGSTSKNSKTGSFRALADSLKRSVSRDWSRKGQNVSPDALVIGPADVSPADARLEPGTESGPGEEMLLDPVAASPASTVGITRRHSTITLLERPSTIRICSPTPDTARPDRQESNELPFTNMPNIKERRSMAPLRSSISQPSASSGAMSRKSMSALPSSTSASLQSIYPPLPSTPMPAAFPPLPPLPRHFEMPGSFPSPQPIDKATTPAPSVVFGAGPGVSNAQFSNVAAQMLADLNARLPQGSARFGEELLKGKKAEVDKLVDFNVKLGEGGWGMQGSLKQEDRYAKQHEKEFAKMKSIAGLGSSRTATIEGPPTPLKRKLNDSSSSLDQDAEQRKPAEAPKPKKSRLSVDAGASLRALRPLSVQVPPKSPKLGYKSPLKTFLQRNKERKALLKRATFGFLKRHTAARSTVLSASAPLAMSVPKISVAEASTVDPDSASIAESTMTAASSFVVTEPSKLRRRSIGPENALQRHSVLVQDSLRRSATSIRRRSQDLSSVLKRQPEVLMQPNRAEPGRYQTARQPSVATQASTGTTSTSTFSSRRGPIPDFGGSSRSGSTSQVNSLGLPRAKSSTPGASLKKQSQADLDKSARPAPLPPAATRASGLPIPVTVSVSTLAPVPAPQATTSRLLQPTASSLARSQAAKPRGARPLPKAPVSRQASAASGLSIASAVMGPPATATPFGTTTTRSSLFESNFHDITRPAAPSVTSSKIPRAEISAPSPLRPKHSVPLRGTPGKGTPSSSRIRKQASGIQAVKSQRNMRAEVEVQRKREEIKAKQERRTEERELRAMLG